MRLFSVWEDKILLNFSVFLLTKGEDIFYSFILSFFSLSSPHSAGIAPKMCEGMNLSSQIRLAITFVRYY
jgi:hypothetical protein